MTSYVPGEKSAALQSQAAGDSPPATDKGSIKTNEGKSQPKKTVSKKFQKKAKTRVGSKTAANSDANEPGILDAKESAGADVEQRVTGKGESNALLSEPKNKMMNDSDADVEKAAPGLTYDFAIVTPKISSAYMQDLRERIESAGFVTDMFESVALTGDQAVQFLRVALPIERAQEFASATRVPARLNPTKLREACAALQPPITFSQKAKGGRSFTEVSEINGYWPPFLHIFGDFRMEKRDLYLPFIAHNYQKIQLRILAGSERLPGPVKGAGLNIREMDQCLPHTTFKADGDGEGPKIATIMLLHEPLEDKNNLRNKLYEEWIKGGKTMHMPWKVPVHRIREYLGDQMGFYFLFLSTFASHCIPIGFVGVVTFIAMIVQPMSEKKERQMPLVVFAPCVVCSMIGFMTHFRRKQAEIGKEWGCYAWTASKLKVRPAFRGKPQTCPIDGHIVVDFSRKLQARRSMQAWALISFLLCIVLCIVGGIFCLQAWFLSHDEDSFLYKFGPHLCTALNVAQVQVLNFLYTRVAKNLTEYENWKTDPEYSYNLIAKLFFFKFINTFAAVYYVAFFKKHIDKNGCEGDGGCLWELTLTVMPIFISGAILSFVMDIIIPWVKQRRIKQHTGGNYGTSDNEDDNTRMIIRRQFNEMPEYDNIDGPINDCMKIVLDFGYMSCFGGAFPLSPFMALGMYFLKLKQDGYKLLWIHRRMISMEVCNLGVWEDIVYFLLMISIPTSMGIVCFTSRVFDDVGSSKKWVIFFMGTNTLYAIAKLANFAFPPHSAGLRMQLKRQAIYSSRVLYELSTDGVFDEAEPEPDPRSSILMQDHKSYL